MAREIQLSRGKEEKKKFLPFFFFLCEIIIVESLQYSRMGHLDGNRGKINERESVYEVGKIGPREEERGGGWGRRETRFLAS